VIKDFVVVDILDERATFYEQGERGNIRIGGTKRFWQVRITCWLALLIRWSFKVLSQQLSKQTFDEFFSGQEIESWHYSSIEEGDRRQHYLGRDTSFVVILYSRTPTRTGMKIVRGTNG